VTKDRQSVVELAERTPQFTKEERECLCELLDEYLREGKRSGYDFLAAVEDNTCMGFVCFGDVSLTDACYDLYWIVTDPAYQRQGIGGKLLAAVEKVLQLAGARKLFAETSSLESYQPAHKFYVRQGFGLAACIPDFYKPGDDKIIFVKDITG